MSFTPPTLAIINCDEIARFIDIWGLETAEQRLDKRMQSSFNEICEFHEVMNPKVDEIIAFLNQFPLNDIPPEYHKLSHTVLAILEVDDAVNNWNQTNLDLSYDPRKWRTKSSFYSGA